MATRPAAARALVIFCALCAALSLLVYARAFDNPFRQDDFTFLQHVETRGLPDVLLPGPEFAFFRPGSVTLFALEHAFFGRRSGCYIAFNYVLHALIAVLAFLTVQRLRGRNVAALASALFLVGFGHYGKQVMWACTSGPLMSVALTTASILVLLDGTRSSARSKADGSGRVAASAGLLAVAVLFHEAAAIMCVVAAAIVLAKTDGPRRWEAAAPLLVLFSAALVLWVAHTRNVGYSAVGTGEAVANAPMNLVSYLGFMLLPLQSTALIDTGTLANVLALVTPVVHAALGAAVLVALVFTVARRGGAARLLALWLLAAMIPFTVLPHPPGRLELRYLYPASIPFCALAAMSIIALYNRNRRGARLLAGTIALLAVAGSVALQLILESRYDQWR